jgi:hypothetical protein
LDGIFSGHFLLTKLLLKKMNETGETTGIQGRIVNDFIEQVRITSHHGHLHFVLKS